MKKIFEVAGLLLLIQGVGGLLHEWFDWFPLTGLVTRLGFLNGYEVFADIVLTVVGCAVLIASDRVTDR
ncbi:hypothetical protein [Streptomyces sp. NBC_01465]|uniref:hypothetical protein n=1 Tax=Streptomyces sp. NBC_01465 TaxID=2903878 RepID=UPI002E306721|nr:hypothetical protein [Streptomyces sp. NBC_01465]